MDRLMREDVERLRSAVSYSTYMSPVEWNALCDLALQSLSQGAVRDEALEEAARECGLCASRQATKHDQKVRDQTRRDIASAIRALKREPNAAAEPHEYVDAPTGAIEEHGPAPAAPDVASMVKECKEVARILNEIYTGPLREEIDFRARSALEQAALLAKLGQGWIRVSERLPEENVRVFVYREVGAAFNPCIAQYRYITGRGGYWEYEPGFVAPAPIYWMPLPPAPGASDA